MIVVQTVIPELSGKSEVETSKAHNVTSRQVVSTGDNLSEILWSEIRLQANGRLSAPVFDPRCSCTTMVNRASSMGVDQESARP
jgi:hypothetical protein